MNVLTLGARVIGPEPAYECAVAFLGATFSGEARHRAGSARSSRSRPRRADWPGNLPVRAAYHEQPTRRCEAMRHGPITIRSRTRAYPSEVTMTDPTSIATAPARFSLGDAAAAYDAAVERARDEDWATRLFDRDVTLWSSDERVQARSPTGSAGSMPRRISPTTSPRSRDSATRSSTEGFTHVVVAGMGGSSLAPGCPPPDVRERRTATRSCASSTRRIRPTSRPTLDDLDPLRTLTIIATKSGTTTEPNAFLADAWERDHDALDAIEHHPYEGRAASSSRSPTRTRASTRSPTTTTSARSSSTRPTSAAGTRR